jgi:hypothetical protein
MSGGRELRQSPLWRNPGLLTKRLHRSGVFRVGAPGIELGDENGLPLASGSIFWPNPVVNDTPEPDVLDEKKCHGKNISSMLLVRHWNINTFFRV